MQVVPITENLKTTSAHMQRLETLFWETRQFSLTLCAPLEREDMVVQSDFVVSPIKWHLGHTAWLFEKFILEAQPWYTKYGPEYDLVFNSYYTSLGTLFDKGARGMLSRPTVDQVLSYRSYVEAGMAELMRRGCSDAEWETLELGIHHEKQHQELMLYDIKHIFWSNPLHPVYLPGQLQEKHAARDMEWVEFEGGLYEVGAARTDNQFAYDNEGPRHKNFLVPFAMANRNVTNGEYLEFVESGGYKNPQPWLSFGHKYVIANALNHPLYWQKMEGAWHEFTLHGWEPLNLELPVTHISFYEADAYARWRDCRLPTEFEWEHVGNLYPHTSNLADVKRFAPIVEHEALGDMGILVGNCWQYTASAYLPYPGYRFINNGLGEYNGKFMSNQMVLRGASCMTPDKHVRPTYRNFFEPDSRWQCAGIRLAK